jgi:hypothetical protein
MVAEVTQLLPVLPTAAFLCLTVAEVTQLPPVLSTAAFLCLTAAEVTQLPPLLLADEKFSCLMAGTQLLFALAVEASRHLVCSAQETPLRARRLDGIHYFFEPLRWAASQSFRHQT